MSKTGWGLMLVACLFVQGVQAQSLAQREEQNKMTKDTDAQVESINKACGTSITASWDWDSFSKEDRRDLGVSSYCKDAMSGIRMVCESSTVDGKAAVQEGIKSIVCKRATPSTMELKDGVFTYGLDMNDSNITYRARDYLMDNL